MTTITTSGNFAEIITDYIRYMKLGVLPTHQDYEYVLTYPNNGFHIFGKVTSI